MKKKIRKHYNFFPVIGKYIDTSTKSKLEVIYFTDDVGDYKLSLGPSQDIILKSCRFQIKNSQIKIKKKFSKYIQEYLNISAANELEGATSQQVPLLFGLLKLRKGKTRIFVLIAEVVQHFNSKVTNILAVKIDNLLYIDLASRLKNKA